MADDTKTRREERLKAALRENLRKRKGRDREAADRPEAPPAEGERP